MEDIDIASYAYDNAQYVSADNVDEVIHVDGASNKQIIFFKEMPISAAY